MYSPGGGEADKQVDSFGNAMSDQQGIIFYETTPHPVRYSLGEFSY